MIPEQLDLFGGPPKPPKRIREEEPDTTSAMPEQETTTTNDDSQMATTSLPEPDEMLAEPATIALPVLQDEEEHLPDWIAEEAQEEAAHWEASSDEKAHLPIESTEQTDTTQQEDDVSAESHIAPPVSDVIAWMAPEPIGHIEITDENAPEKAGNTFIEPVSDIVVEFPSGKRITTVISSPATDIGTPAQMNVPPDEELFKRQYYSMRETAAMFDISHSMLRYWENEFDVLQPRKNRKGDRYFRPVDVKHLQLIYHLLKVRRFTIEGAREYLRNHNKALDTFELIKKLEKLKSFLIELKANVS